MEGQRILFIDYIKAFSISLIIISHCIGWFGVNEIVNKVILSIHVPIFFIAVGILKNMLRKEESLFPFIRKRSRQLLIPYFWFSLYNSMVKLSMLSFGIAGGLTMSALKGEAIEFFITGNGTVWFLATLFFAETFFVWVKSFNKNWLTISLAIVLSIIPYLWKTTNPFLVVIGRFFSAYSLIVVGWYATYLLRYKNLTAPLSAILMIIWLYLVFNTNWDFSFFDGHFGHPLSTIPTILSGGISIVLFFSLLDKMRFPHFQYIGKNSLILMLVHPTFLLIGMYGVYPMLHLSGNGQILLFSIVLTVIVFSLSLLCVPIIHKYLPFVLGEKRLKYSE